MPARSVWRDLVKVHPAADLFPMMAGAELRALSDDIKINGLKHRPVYFLTRETRKLLLDGRNRLAAMELAGLPTDGEGNTVKEGEVDPYAYVISTNIHRRHLTQDQKRGLIILLLKEDPQRSDRATAKLAHVDHKTVAAARGEAERGGEIPHHETHVGSDGVPQRVRDTRDIPPLSTETLGHMQSLEHLASTAPNRADEKAVKKALPTILTQLSSLLQLRPDKMIEELVRILGAAKAAIKVIPKEKRIAAARGFLRALDISEPDLRPVG